MPLKICTCTDLLLGIVFVYSHPAAISSYYVASTVLKHLVVVIFYNNLGCKQCSVKKKTNLKINCLKTNNIKNKNYIH